MLSYSFKFWYELPLLKWVKPYFKFNVGFKVIDILFKANLIIVINILYNRAGFLNFFPTNFFTGFLHSKTFISHLNYA